MTTAVAPSTGAAPASTGAVFTRTELRRVGVAATMIAIGGTAIVLLMLLAMGGYYSSLSHALPKAILDGVVIAMLMGRQSRWRCLALLGVVYGLVLQLQLGVAYLLPVMAIAGIVGAATGWAISLTHRATAVLAAAVVYEVLAGFGAPVKIYFGTDGKHEPFVWALWFLEWPLRIVGASAGVWLGWRLSKSDRAAAASQRGFEVIVDSDVDAAADGTQRDSRRIAPVIHHGTRDRRLISHGRGAAAIRLAASIVACVLPMMLGSWTALGIVAAVSLVYAVWAGMRWGILHVMLGLIWGWVIFAGLSYLWHQDIARVVDMLRTFVLRFMPLMLASLVLVTTTRPVDVIRVLRTLKVSGVVLIPLAGVVRSIPHSRREVRTSIESMRQQGLWTGPWSLLRRPVPVLRQVLGPQFRRWRRELAEE